MVTNAMKMGNLQLPYNWLLIEVFNIELHIGHSSLLLKSLTNSMEEILSNLSPTNREKFFFFNSRNILKTYFETPTLPKVRVLDISGRIHTRFFLCSGCLIQSSQNLEININQCNI